MQGEADGTMPLSAEEVERGRDIDWAWHDPEVREKYPDQFIAVYHRQVIAHGDELFDVLAEAQRITGQPRHRIAVTSVLGPKSLLLAH